MLCLGRIPAQTNLMLIFSELLTSSRFDVNTFTSNLFDVNISSILRVKSVETTEETVGSLSFGVQNPLNQCIEALDNPKALEIYRKIPELQTG